MKVYYIAGETYIKVSPAKTLFHSTMVHEVVNRGDCFVVRLSDGVLTVLSGKLLSESARRFESLVLTQPQPVDEDKTIGRNTQIRTPRQQIEDYYSPEEAVQARRGKRKDVKTDTVTVKKMKEEIAKAKELVSQLQQTLGI